MFHTSKFRPAAGVEVVVVDDPVVVEPEQIVTGRADLDELCHALLSLTCAASRRTGVEPENGSPSPFRRAAQRQQLRKVLIAAATTPDASTRKTTAKTRSVYTGAHGYQAPPGVAADLRVCIYILFIFYITCGTV